jgi:hypothetical protein
MDDATLLAQFEDCTLPELTHRDHVRLVFLYTQQGRAYERVRAGLIAYTASRGSESAFHQTRTWAWAELIAAAAAEFDGDFDAFWMRHPEFDRRNLLDDYYSDILKSDAARTTVLQPDLRPL